MHLDGKLIKAVLDASERLKLDICLLDEMGDVLVSRDDDSVNTVDNWLEQAVFEDGRAEVTRSRALLFPAAKRKLQTALPRRTRHDAGSRAVRLAAVVAACRRY